MSDETAKNTRPVDHQPSESAPRRPLKTRLPEGSMFGRYQITRLLGEGGMGEVYLAHDTGLDRLVAIKLPNFAQEDGDEAVERFFRECRAAATLQHPNICPVFDVGQMGDRHFMVMAFIEGQPLSDFIHPDRPMSERQVVAFVRKLALALEDAHHRGIIHRDLKPANIMVTAGKQEPILMDFGLARRSQRTDESIRLTQQNVILGTPAYIPPERIRARYDEEPQRTYDMFSLGVILFEMLTGRLPFTGDSAMAVLISIANDPTPKPSDFRTDLDPRLDAICLKAMEKDPRRRYQTMAELAATLTEFLKSPYAPPPPPRDPGSASSRKLKEVLEAAPAATRRPETAANPTRTKADQPRPVAAPPVEDLNAIETTFVAHTKRHQPAPSTRLARSGSKTSVGIKRDGLKLDENAKWERGGLTLSTVLLAVVGVIGGGAMLVYAFWPTTSIETESSKEQLISINPVDPKEAPAKKPPLDVSEVVVAAGTITTSGGKKLALPQPLSVSQHEITQAQFRAIRGDSPSWWSRTGGGKASLGDTDPDLLPVDRVNWLEAVAFCNQLSERRGLSPYYSISDTGDVSINATSDGYRLPTVAEWEYLARGGQPTDSPLGETPANTDDRAWHSGNAKGRPHPVGSKTSNEFGLFDIYGNLGEWCQDSDSEAPTFRVVCGGSYLTVPGALRPEIIATQKFDVRSEMTGFRVVRSLPAVSEPTP